MAPRPAHAGLALRRALGRVLMTGGVLSSDWAPSFAAVPRSAFLPDLMWPFDMETGRSVSVSRSEDPERWYGYADSDVPVVTQWDDGKHVGTEPGEVSTSSASMPSVVFRMLNDLDVQPGNRVLEIGTGTGWNAALLAHRLRVENVVTVEVDSVVANDGESATGAFTGPVEFMKARTQRLSPVVHTEYVSGGMADRDKSSTTITEDEFMGERFSPQRFAMGIKLRDCVCVMADKRHGKRPVWFYGLTDRSWACAMFSDGDDAQVWQSGPRRIWNEAESAYRWWTEKGKPGYDRFGLTVTAEGQSAWLDDPGNCWPV
ncbi:protein-L-isoaspartate(D-aspartate) O-methyltransferase [Streptomyces sp. NPDC091292]|uniref:protein-L-isoaspartate(D-aspartate) O-methyltransferase n=1 Tax=Streptomyces sp. NPDC091292 TaxID=3365991 RepID=UPI00380ECF26